MTQTHWLNLLAYERHATAQAAGSLASVPEHHRSDAAYARALSIFAHTQQATHLWLSRLGVVPARRFEMFPAWSLEQSLADAASSHDALERFLTGLDQAGAARIIKYTSTEGVAYGSSVADILTHVFNHATYHRGQIAVAVTPLGGTRAVTDFIAFTRRPLSPARQ